MRETVAGLKVQIGILEQRVKQRDDERDKLYKSVEELKGNHSRELESIRATRDKLLRLNQRFAARNDALQYALYLAQMVTRSVQERLDKCDALVKSQQVFKENFTYEPERPADHPDKLSIAS